MDVTVVGAGIGGLAIAHGLLATGHQVTVLERGSQASTGDAAVTIFSNGAAALAGLGPRLDGIGTRIDELQMRHSDGRALLRTQFAPLVERSGFAVRTVPRAALIHRLSEGLPTNVIHYGVSVDRIDAQSVRPLVVDTSGAARATDVVVGADGYRSVVRRVMLDPAAARDSGWATWQGLSRVLPAVAASSTGLLQVGDAGLVGMMPAGDALVQWWFDVRWSPQAPPATSPARWLREQFGAYAEPVPQLIDSITDADLGFYPHVVHHVPDRWGTGSVTLLGDAAHAFPPSQAQGANQALEDAWVLTRVLAAPTAATDPIAALRAYERQRAPRVRRVSRIAESERTNRSPSKALAAAARLTPTRLTSHAYARLVYSFSNVLNEK